MSLADVSPTPVELHTGQVQEAWGWAALCPVGHKPHFLLAQPCPQPNGPWWGVSSWGSGMSSASFWAPKLLPPAPSLRRPSPAQTSGPSPWRPPLTPGPQMDPPTSFGVCGNPDPAEVSVSLVPPFQAGRVPESPATGLTLSGSEAHSAERPRQRGHHPLLWGLHSRYRAPPAEGRLRLQPGLTIWPPTSPSSSVP